MTIDNIVDQIYYNGVQLSVGGALGNWGSVKIFSFATAPRGVLAVSGRESGNCNGCSCAGMKLECTGGSQAPNSDNTNWAAMGYDSSGERDALSWFANYFSGEVSAPCISSSGFNLPGSTGAGAKIWPSNGAKYAIFRVSV